MSKVGQTVTVVGCATALIVAYLSSNWLIDVAAYCALVLIMTGLSVMALRRASQKIDADLDALERHAYRSDDADTTEDSNRKHR